MGRHVTRRPGVVLMAERTLAQRRAIALATAKATVGGGAEQSGAADVLRPAEFAARGFTENAMRAVGALPELAASGMRAVGLEDYAPEPGYYQDKLRSGAQAVGETISEPFNRAFGFTDAGGVPTNQFGPNQPVGTLERGAMGAGRGAADVGAFMLPGYGVSKLGGVTGQVGKTVLSQPVVQVGAGMVGGATTELTDNPWIGLSAALGTGVGASMMLTKIAAHGATTLAEKKILALISKIGGGSIDDGMRAVEQRLAQGGRDTALVDVTGIKGEKLARASANVPEGEAATITDDFIGQRAATRGERYQEAADTFGPRRNMPALEDQMNAAQKMKAGPHYEQAYAANPTVVSKEIDLILGTPNGKRALADAIEMMQNDRSMVGKIDPALTQLLKDAVQLGKMPNVKGGVTPGLNLRTLDYVKRALYDIESSLSRGGEKTKAGIAGAQRRSLTAELDTADATGSYAKARAAFGAIEKEKEAVELGTKFLRGDADVTAAELAAMAPAEQEAARMGARKALGDLIRVDRQGAATKLADKKDALWDRIYAIFPKDEADKFRSLVAAENKKMSVDRFVSPRAGSPTAGIQQDVAELGRQLPESAMKGIEAVGQLAAGHPIRALGVIARPAIEYIARPDSKTAESLAAALLETSPAIQKTMLQALAAKAKTVPNINVRMISSLMGKTTAAQELGDLEPEPLVIDNIRPMQKALGAN